MTVQPRQRVKVNSVNRTVEIPHIGVTLRVILGAVLDKWGEPCGAEYRDYKVSLDGELLATLHARQPRIFDTKQKG